MSLCCGLVAAAGVIQLPLKRLTFQIPASLPQSEQIDVKKDIRSPQTPSKISIGTTRSDGDLNRIFLKWIRHYMTKLEI